MRTLEGKRVELSAAAVEEFGARLQGQLLTPDSAGYDEARSIWNGMIDRRPALIAQCAGTADVVEAVSLRPRARAIELGQVRAATT